MTKEEEEEEEERQKKACEEGDNVLCCHKGFLSFFFVRMGVLGVFACVLEVD